MDNIIKVKNTEDFHDTQAEIIIQNNITYTPKVSVIIPVYNAEKYLRECLDSIVNQTLKDIEIICVDDGSIDSSLDILKEYATKDNRITILNQKNLYAGVARNAGIAIARGEYVHFVDSDDWIDTNAYKDLYEIIEKQKANFIKFKAYSFDNQLNQIVPGEYTDMEFIKESSMVSIDNNMKLALDMIDSPWSGIYNLQFLKENGIYFDEMICVNDVSFYYRCLTKSRSFYFYNKKFVYYRINNSKSLIGNKPYHFECQIELFNRARKIFQDESYLCIDTVIHRLSQAIIANSKKYIRNKNIDKKTRNKIANMVKVFYKENAELLHIMKYSFLEQIFSVKNEYFVDGKMRKVITILGLKIKSKRKER